MLNSFVRLVNLYWRFLVSPEKYALHIGIKIGKNCFIATREWSSEPYLISIGYNCQIIKNVYIHTHGGGQAVRNICPEFDTYGKVTINDWTYVGANSHIMPGVTILFDSSGKCGYKIPLPKLRYGRFRFKGI